MTNFNLGLNAPQLAGQTGALSKAKNLFGNLEDLKAAGVNFENVTPLELALADALAGSEERIKRSLDEQFDRQLKAAEQAQRLGKGSVGYMSMMNQINNLPGTIASAFGGAGERQLTQELYGKIPEVVSETYRTFPRMQIQPVGFSAPSARYFS
jgi:hypothetical protein